jgi:hypothetical protein
MELIGGPALVRFETPHTRHLLLVARVVSFYASRFNYRLNSGLRERELFAANCLAPMELLYLAGDDDSLLQVGSSVSDDV